MPYINKNARLGLDNHNLLPQGAGELNYMLTHLCIGYWVANGRESYQTYNDILGALEGCKLELYRRKVAPYEDKKIIENGDVYYDWNERLQPKTKEGTAAPEPHSQGPAESEVQTASTEEQEETNA